MAGPLSGVRVLDVTSVLMGPFSTQLLGDLGAEILKVEPLRGDDTRFAGHARNRRMGGGFLNTNRNKKSIAVDLKSPAGRDAVLRLAATCDAFVSNVRPKALARLGQPIILYMPMTQLAGITRATVAKVASTLQLKLIERPFTVADAQAAREAFMTSATSFVTPIVKIDGKAVGEGKPGDTARRLRAEYFRAVSEAPSFL